MGFFSRIRRMTRPQMVDGTRLYQALMAQSRQPVFYGDGKVSDTYEGRIDCLTLHMSLVMAKLNQLGETGTTLSQAIFDVMVSDFDTALREEGLTDSGVKRRIKPIVSLFYARLKSYSEAISAANPKLALGHAFAHDILSLSDAFKDNLAEYAIHMSANLSDLTTGQIASLDFEFPELPE
jgi:cytochrome b pre-mRNA-processing protein 3